MAMHYREVWIPAGGVQLDGVLSIVPGSRAVVVFAHGSGSGRHSGRNWSVAGELQRAGICTLLFDLLTEEEAEAERYTRHLRFDIDLLALRLTSAARWLPAPGGLGPGPLSIGYFGASTGAAAALLAAARAPENIDAIVSRGGRPDLAGPGLAKVLAPTLLIVGSEDRAVLELNREAAAQLRAPHELEVVRGATHLFEEPGTLEEVAGLARRWFATHLIGQPSREESPPLSPW